MCSEVGQVRPRFSSDNLVEGRFGNEKNIHHLRDRDATDIEVPYDFYVHVSKVGAWVLGAIAWTIGSSISAICKSVVCVLTA